MAESSPLGPSPGCEPPTPDAPWSHWLAWLSWASHQVGAYEAALSLADLHRLTRGLRQLCLRLETETVHAHGGSPHMSAGAVEAASIHRQHLLMDACQHCDETRLLVGTLARRISSEEAEGLPSWRRPGVSSPDRLRQQVRQQLQLLQAALGRLEASRSPKAISKTVLFPCPTEGGGEYQ
ncbi:hypothetical protein [Thermogemmatispora carboxidivorans]|uniref:hypothetical protein n=1 Tax=Thermogemmatispora carboxidivorans TaxID=1382306 RepID=UPI00069A6E53|nr:hypothetical protein [Thermogemmatispora carboxidivorans]